MDYYKLHLQQYMKEHRFDHEDIHSEFVDDKADSAAQIYDDYRRSGASVDGAIEAAIAYLMTGIGSSRWEVAHEILEEHAGDRVRVDDPIILEFWTRIFADKMDIWTPYIIEGGMGLNDELVEANKSEILAAMDQFFISYGL